MDLQTVMTSEICYDIYIFTVIAIDESVILDVLHFQMTSHVTKATPIDRATPLTEYDAVTNL